MKQCLKCGDLYKTALTMVCPFNFHRLSCTEFILEANGTKCLMDQCCMFLLPPKSLTAPHRPPAVLKGETCTAAVLSLPVFSWLRSTLFLFSTFPLEPQ